MLVHPQMNPTIHAFPCLETALKRLLSVDWLHGSKLDSRGSSREMIQIEVFATYYALPESNIAPEIGHPKRKVVFQPSIFKCYVSCWYRAVVPVYFPRKQMPELVGWGGLGMMTFFALAHMWHATQLLGWWGGLGMMTFFALAHMWHATQLLGWWGGVGWGWWRSLHLHLASIGGKKN